MKEEFVQLHEALLDLTGVLNAPQPDVALISLAGVDLDRALFPLLMQVEQRGAIGIGDLAELCGRDYTTVSRQVSKLENLGLVSRRANEHDARIKQVTMTEVGRKMTGALGVAREKMLTSLLKEWDKKDIQDLARLLRQLADDALRFIRR